MIQQDQEEVLRDAHESWMQHPTTRQLVSNLKKHRQAFVNGLSVGAMSPNVTDAHIRYLAVGLRNVDSVIHMITNYDAFKTTLERE